MPKLKQVVHRLLGARAIIADRVVQIPLREIIVHDDHRIFRSGEIGQEGVTIAIAQAKHAIHKSPLE